MFLFSLDELEKLPNIITNALLQQEKLEQVAENGYQKTLHRHTWEYETEKLLVFLDKREIGR